MIYRNPYDTDADQATPYQREPQRQPVPEQAEPQNPRSGEGEQRSISTEELEQISAWIAAKKKENKTISELYEELFFLPVFLFDLFTEILEGKDTDLVESWKTLFSQEELEEKIEKQREVDRQQYKHMKSYEIHLQYICSPETTEMYTKRAFRQDVEDDPYWLLCILQYKIDLLAKTRERKKR